MTEALLWQEYQTKKSEEARQRIIIEYLPLVKQIVGRVLVQLPSHLDTEDLISFGIIGLMDAVDKFDFKQGVRFSTYAYTRIKGAIYDELRKVHILPRTVMQQMKTYAKVQSELENIHGGECSNKIIAETMGVAEEELEQMLQQINMFSMVSIDEVLDFGKDQAASRVEFIEDKQATNPLEKIEKKEEVKILAQAIDNLQERDKLILSLYYYEELNLLEIGRVLNVSESRVCQLHARALVRLRDKLEKLSFLAE